MPKKLSLPDVLYALSDPVRLKIVHHLATEGETACGVFDIDMPKSSLSHHFKVLRDAGVIATRGEGVRRMNSLRSEELDAAFPGLLNAVVHG
ncbi:MAG TPA: metalloregulator ArsR/SmtB family transcription factor, partial [Thermoanaerobaculia bacterium]|nr:metalloregulator ArsR/SmtB family transcription factor [Thermoanaerobaculia bacterium]